MKALLSRNKKITILSCDSSFVHFSVARLGVHHVPDFNNSANRPQGVLAETVMCVCSVYETPPVTKGMEIPLPLHVKPHFCF